MAEPDRPAIVGNIIQRMRFASWINPFFEHHYGNCIVTLIGQGRAQKFSLHMELDSTSPSDIR